jgi:anaphase-promoting complex subunit 8
MVQCFGRTVYIYKMPNKPVKQGYKIFALAEHGYIWTFSWSSRQLGIEEMFKWPGLTPTIRMGNMEESLKLLKSSLRYIQP